MTSAYSRVRSLSFAVHGKGPAPNKAGLVSVTALNMYGGSLTLISSIDSFKRVRPTLSVRVITIGLTAVLSLIGALAATANFLHNFNNFLLLTLYLFVPWTAVNLVDSYAGLYYLFTSRRGGRDPGGPGRNGRARRGGRAARAPLTRERPPARRSGMPAAGKAFAPGERP
jgi:hypothetical protein